MYGVISFLRIDDESSNKVPDFSPYYPHHQLSSDSTAACLKTILNRYYGEEPEPPATSPSPRVMPPQTTPSQSLPPSMSTTILSSVETPPLPPPPPPSRPSPSLLVPLGTELPMKPPKSPKTSLETPTAQTKLTSSPTRGKAAKAPAAAKTAQVSSAVLQVQKRNHVAKRVAQKFTLPSLLNVKSAKTTSRKAAGKLLIHPKNSVDKLKASKIIEQLRLNSQHVHAKPSSPSSFSSPVGPGHVRANSGQFLTRLPPRTPYQALLLALSQASKPSKVPAVPFPPKQQQQQQPYISLPTTTAHTHSVFHDHFALLSEPHVPSEFCLPLTSLSLQYPIDIYTSCVRSRIARAEHSYAKPPNTSPNGEARGRGEDSTNAQQLNLKLSLPRSLLQTNDACGCDRGALVFCSQCQSLYHNVCSTSTLCSTCVTLKSLNLS